MMIRIDQIKCPPIAMSTCPFFKISECRVNFAFGYRKEISRIKRPVSIYWKLNVGWFVLFRILAGRRRRSISISSKSGLQTQYRLHQAGSLQILPVKQYHQELRCSLWKSGFFLTTLQWHVTCSCLKVYFYINTRCL